MSLGRDGSLLQTAWGSGGDGADPRKIPMTTAEQVALVIALLISLWTKSGTLRETCAKAYKIQPEQITMRHLSVFTPRLREGIAATDAVGPMRPATNYDSAHALVRRIRGRDSEHMCSSCRMCTAVHWAYDHEDPDAKLGKSRSGASVYDSEFSTDPSHYLPLCVPCHYRLDDQHLTAARGGRRGRTPQWKIDWLLAHPEASDMEAGEAIEFTREWVKRLRKKFNPQPDSGTRSS